METVVVMNDFTQCSICYFKIKKLSQKKVLDCQGNHTFHQKCIWKWLANNNTCPLCRDVVSKYPSFQCEFNEHYHFINALSTKS